MRRGKLCHQPNKISNYNHVGQPPDVLGITVIKPLNKLFANAVKYSSYTLIRELDWYDYDAANDQREITKNTAVQINNRTDSGKHAVSIIAFWRDFKKSCSTCNIPDSAVIWAFEHYLPGRAEAVIRAPVALTTEAA